MSSTTDRPVRTSRRRRLAALVVLLGAATAAGTFLQGALSVLSSSVIEEFDISRSQLGIAFTVFSLTGGIASPAMGRLTDASTRLVMAGLFVVATAGLLLAAFAPGFLWLLGAAVVGGMALASGNPATNKIVSQRISLQRRGLVIGVKQSGPPLGLLVAGVLLPPLAALLGWRLALALTAAVPLAGLIATHWLVPGSGVDGQAAGRNDPEPEADGRAGRLTVWYLAIIGLLVAMGAAGIIAFVPLYAQESIGLTESIAGLLAALMGLTGVLARVVWGASANRFSHAAGPMIALAAASVLATLCIWAAITSAWLLWLGVVAAGLSMLAWHAVAWLALLNNVGRAGVGRATGRVQLGNSVGFAAGPPVVGLLVDTSGYGTGWAVLSGLFVVATLLTVVWHRTR